MGRWQAGLPGHHVNDFPLELHVLGLEMCLLWCGARGLTNRCRHHAAWESVLEQIVGQEGVEF